MTKEELDSMLVQWADTELDVPEGFHESVMMRLRAEESKQTQTVQALPTVRETLVRSLGQKDPPEKAMTPPGKSPGRRSMVGYSPWGRRVGHN